MFFFFFLLVKCKTGTYRYVRIFHACGNFWNIWKTDFYLFSPGNPGTNWKIVAMTFGKPLVLQNFHSSVTEKSTFYSKNSKNAPETFLRDFLQFSAKFRQPFSKIFIPIPQFGFRYLDRCSTFSKMKPLTTPPPPLVFCSIPLMDDLRRKRFKIFNFRLFGLAI